MGPGYDTPTQPSYSHTYLPHRELWIAARGALLLMRRVSPSSLLPPHHVNEAACTPRPALSVSSLLAVRL
jgi:hypothetical protein